MMKRRIFTLVIMALLGLSVFPQAACAAGSSSLAPVRVYQDQFTDIAPEDWYYNNVKSLYELGLTNGKGSENTFDPEGDITVAEVLTMAARLRGLWEAGNSEAAGQFDGDGWYGPYVTYLQSLHVIGTEFDGAYNRAATRAEMAHVLANTLPQTFFSAINGDVVRVGNANQTYIADVNRTYTPYGEEILLLYQWGILSGVDETGTFLPYQNIPRCEVAAMVTRLAYSDLRIRLPWDLDTAYDRTGTVMTDLVYSDGTFYADPDPNDKAALDADLRYMLSRGGRQIRLQYAPNTLTSQVVDQIMEAFLDTARYYLEQTYNEIQCSYSIRGGVVELTFSSSLYEDQLLEPYRKATLESAISLHNAMWSEGYVTKDTSDYEKAQIYFTWICNQCRYDYASKDDSMSHSGYNAFAGGLVVCDGYSAAYNLLLKLEGIQCTTYSMANHIWTVAELDGKSYHIDTTWGDREETIAYRYFGMTEAEAVGRFQ